MATSFDGRESVSDFTFRAHAWPRACTIEVGCSCEQLVLFVRLVRCSLIAVWCVLFGSIAVVVVGAVAGFIRQRLQKLVLSDTHNQPDKRKLQQCHLSMYQQANLSDF